MNFLGSDLVSSWGLVQKLLKSKPKLKNSEFEDDEKYDEKYDLKKIIWNLEKHRKFYEEYVISIPSETLSESTTTIIPSETPSETTTTTLETAITNYFIGINNKAMI